MACPNAGAHWKATATRSNGTVFFFIGKDSLEVLGYLLEFFQVLFPVLTGIEQALIETSFNVLLHEGPLRILNGVGDGVELLRYLEAGLFFLDHLDYLDQMAIGAPKAIYDLGVVGVLMFVVVAHGHILSPRRG
tara:strand:+ start:282 stop:683 length:402 start_codon:yes stop_codon:yes gene_type:complete